MSGQMTLFKTEKKIDEKIEEDVEIDVITTNERIKEKNVTENDKYGWKQLPDTDTKRLEGIDYAHIQLFSKSDLTGTENWASYSHTHENPKSMLGSSWGGGKSFNLKIDEIKEIFDMLIERKKEQLEEPYRMFTDEETEIAYEHHNVYYDFRLIPAKNYFIIINDELCDILKKTGFDFEKWYQDYKALPELVATEDDWKKALEKLKLIEKGNKICKKLDDLQSILLLKNIDELKNTKKEVKELFEKQLNTLKQIDDEIDEYAYDIKNYQNTLMKCWW
jgi:hypothetical protein